MLPLLRQSRRGRIVNVSSQVGAFESSGPYGFQQITQEALRAAEVVFLAAPYQVNAAALAGLTLRGTVLADAPIPSGRG
jgi:predicted dinucleotide-binding enzyme